MTPESTSRELAYPYWRGWHSRRLFEVVLFGLIGTIGVSLFPTGLEKVNAGQLPTGIAPDGAGHFRRADFGDGVLVGDWWSARYAFFRRVRGHGHAPILPKPARGEPPQDEHGEPISKEPPHPETIPFSAIRNVTRSGLDSTKSWK